MKTTKLTLENEYGIYAVEVNKSNMEISDVFETLIAPILLAAGYSTDNIKEWQL